MEGVNCRLSKSFVCGIALLSLAAVCAAQKSASGTIASLPDCAPLAGQSLRCPKLGFSYKVPFGWVDRTEQMQDSAASTASSGSDDKHSPATGKTLLAVFERPPAIPGDDVNSAVLIAVEDRSAYPQVKTAADYFGPLADIAERRGIKLDGSPYSFSTGARQIVRGDFTGGDQKMPIRQSSLVIVEKGYILSFTFLASSDDEIEGLMESLAFLSTSRKSKK
jgi:hypothetical protein